MGGFLGPFGNVFAGIGGGVTGELECVLGTVGGFHGYGSAGAIDMGDGSIHRLDTIFADFIDFDGCLLGALGGVVRDYFRAFLETVK